MSSQAVVEPLYGTASHAKHWLLVEYDGPWGHKAFEESAIPIDVKSHLSATGAKILLIRQPTSHSAPKRLFSIRLGAVSGAIRYFTFDQYEAILDFDLGKDTSGTPYVGPLFAVCVNGKRDLCCARHGVPFFNALRALAPDATWQCSHIGGHRFAATMLCFPRGICYGRLSAEDAFKILEQDANDQLLLSKYRGQCAYIEPAQSADYYVRAATGLVKIDDLELLDIETDYPIWIVRFTAKNGDIHVVRLLETESDFAVQQSCGIAPVAVKQYRLIRHQIIETINER